MRLPGDSIVCTLTKTLHIVTIGDGM